MSDEQMREGVAVEDLFHLYRKTERDSLLASDPKRGYYTRADMLAGVRAVRDRAIAAAEPHIRRKVLEELIIEAKSTYGHGTPYMLWAWLDKHLPESERMGGDDAIALWEKANRKDN